MSSEADPHASETSRTVEALIQNESYAQRTFESYLRHSISNVDPFVMRAKAITFAHPSYLENQTFLLNRIEAAAPHEFTGPNLRELMELTRQLRQKVTMVAALAARVLESINAPVDLTADE